MLVEFENLFLHTFQWQILRADLTFIPNNLITQTTFSIYFCTSYQNATRDHPSNKKKIFIDVTIPRNQHAHVSIWNFTKINWILTLWTCVVIQDERVTQEMNITLEYIGRHLLTLCLPVILQSIHIFLSSLKRLNLF